MFDCGCHDNDTPDALNMAFFVHSPSKPTTTEKSNGAFKNLFPTLLHFLQESLLIADDNAEDNPNAANILRNERYMEDLMHSCQTAGKAIQSITEPDKVLATRSFKLNEWILSSKAVNGKPKQVSMMGIEQTSPNKRSDLPAAVNMDGEKGVRTLGVAGTRKQTHSVLQ